MLYLDAFYEETDAYMPARLHLARLRQLDPNRLTLTLTRPLMRRMCARVLASWPEPVRGQLIDAHLSPGWWQADVRERGSMAALADELKQGAACPTCR